MTLNLDLSMGTGSGDKEHTRKCKIPKDRQMALL